MERLDAVAVPSAIVCPDCRDTLWRISGARPVRFLCRTGHSYTLPTLQQRQSRATDEALWAAVRALQEKRILLQRGAESLQAEGDTAQAEEARTQARTLVRQEQHLRTLVEALK